MGKFKKIMKIVLKVLGALFAILLMGIIAAVIYFWPFISSVDWSIVTPDNVKALYMAFTRNADDLDADEKALDEKRAEDIKNYVSVSVRDFTDDELAQIESGEKTKTEIVAQIISESFENENTYKDNSTQKPEGDNTTNKAPEVPKESADAILARHISNLYAIQSNFQSRVNDLAVNARNWLHAYKKTMGVTWKDAKVAALKHFTSTASQIETDCYAKVDAEVAALEADLKAIGADTSIVATVKESAYKEMEIKKAKIVQEGTAKMNKE